jgi:hypothetical protein
MHNKTIAETTILLCNKNSQLFWAIRNQDRSTVCRLLESGAKPQDSDLLIAHELGNLDICTLLTKAGAPVFLPARINTVAIHTDYARLGQHPEGRTNY